VCYKVLHRGWCKHYASRSAFWWFSLGFLEVYATPATSVDCRGLCRPPEPLMCSPSCLEPCPTNSSHLDLSKCQSPLALLSRQPPAHARPGSCLHAGSWGARRLTWFPPLHSENTAMCGVSSNSQKHCLNTFLGFTVVCGRGTVSVAVHPSRGPPAHV